MHVCFFIYFNTVIGSLIDILQYVIISHLKNLFLGSDFSLNFVLALPSSRVSALLSVSDLCAPPLQPLVLQPKDKGNLSEWFRSAWSDGEKKSLLFFPNKIFAIFHCDFIYMQLTLRSQFVSNKETPQISIIYC